MSSQASKLLSARPVTPHRGINVGLIFLGSFSKFTGNKNAARTKPQQSKLAFKNNPSEPSPADEDATSGEAQRHHNLKRETLNGWKQEENVDMSDAEVQQEQEKIQGMGHTKLKSERQGSHGKEERKVETGRVLQIETTGIR